MKRNLSIGILSERYQPSTSIPGILRQASEVIHRPGAALDRGDSYIISSKRIDPKIKLILSRPATYFLQEKRGGKDALRVLVPWPVLSCELP